MGKTIVYKHDMPIIQTLIKQDPKLKPLFETVREVQITLSDDYFLSLVSTIIAQQLSGKVATVIYQRFITYYDEVVTPQKILDSDDVALRQLGISYQKISYLKSLASMILSGNIDIHGFHHLDDETIIDELIQVKGIGRWTAQMYLMFTLGREDVCAPLDLGLRKGLSRLLNQEITVKDFENYSEKWKPYRSVVSYFLWKSTD